MSRRRVHAVAVLIAPALWSIGCSSESGTTSPPPPPPPPHTSVYAVGWSVGPGTWTIGFLDLKTTAAGAAQAAAARIAGPSVAAAGSSVDTLVRESDSLISPHLIGPTTLHYLTFDSRGNLWAGLNGLIGEFTRAQQDSGGERIPAVMIGSPEAAGGFAFDAAGNLWVVDDVRLALIELTPAQIAQSGSPTPVDSMLLTGITVAGWDYIPQQLAIDPHGNFWVSAQLSGVPVPPADTVPIYVIAEYTPAQVAAGGAPTPVMLLAQSGVAPVGYGPGIAFDAAGNLWSANRYDWSLTRFDAGTLVPGTNPAPSITITSAGTNLHSATDVTVDASGFVLTANMQATFLEQLVSAYAPAQVAASGQVSPRFQYVPTGLLHLSARARP